ncbi:glycoside hydrolase family 19 protein [Chryseobacterium sp. DT-3]|uniref:glycoside hydrolase family 19 protein n=1 Tax=Chryseobacterium sp. DT-3 TaxID=3396164 RepID=UPI003F1B83FE
MNPLFKHPLSAKYKSLFNKFEVNTPLRLAHFFGQAHHESGLESKRESLNYSVENLLKLFGRHRISELDARKYGRTSSRPADQRAIGNLLYGGKWGKENLGNIFPDDGYKLRGGGIFQITGRSNFQKLSDDTGVDFISNPEIIDNEADSVLAALWFWKLKGLNKYADADDVLSVSKIINLGNAKAKGTPNGLNDRISKTNYYKKLFT